MLVCTVGDLLLDVIVRLQGPSSPGDDTPAATRVTAGGQAANVAAWAAALGAEARLIAKRGDDGASGLAADEIAARGVELVGPVVAAARRRGGVRGRRLRRALDAHRPRPEPTAPRRGDRRRLAARLRRPPRVRVRDARRPDRAGGCARGRRGSGAGRPDQRRPRLGQRDRRLRRGRVARAARGARTGRRVRRRRRARCARPRAARRDARRQARRSRRDRRPRRRPRGARGTRADVVDPTGAGDALAAGFLVGGIDLGLEAAARCVSQAGAMP